MAAVPSDGSFRGPKPTTPIGRADRLTPYDLLRFPDSQLDDQAVHVVLSDPAGTMHWMAAPGLTVVKTFPYRGHDEEWGNTYHFVGSAPSTPADWRTLADSLIAMEVAVYTDVVSVVRVLCYENTDDDSVYTYHLADFGGVVPGTFVSGDGGHTATGDDAVWCGWDTGKRSTKGKPIWLRKYFHDAHVGPSQVDAIDPDQYDALNAFASSALAAVGAWPGIADPEGDAPTGGTRISAFVTTRSLKRRGRRPTSPH